MSSCHTTDEDREKSQKLAQVKGKEGPVGDLRALQDAAQAAAVKARELLMGEAGQAKDRRLPESTGQHMLEEMKQRASGEYEEAKRGMTAKGNKISSMGTITGAIKEKLTQPTDIVNRTRLASRGDPPEGVGEPAGSEHIPPGPTN